MAIYKTNITPEQRKTTADVIQQSNEVLASARAMQAQIKAEGSKPFAGSTFNTGTTPTTTPTTTDVTPTVAYKDVSIPTDYNATEIRRLSDLQKNIYNEQTKEVDERQIQADVLANFQAEVDLQNRLYADKLARAKQTGQSRFGQLGAIQSRRGLFGSTFGEAQESTLNKEQEDVYSGIEEERAAMIGSLQSKARGVAAERIAKKNEARNAGITEHLAFLKGDTENRAISVTSFAQSLLAQGINPSEIDPAKLQQIATDYGTSVSNLIAQYNAEKVKLDKVSEDQLSVEKENALKQSYTQAQINKINNEISKGNYAEMDLGNRTIIYDKNTGKEITSYAKGLAPKAVGSQTVATQSEAITKRATEVTNLITQLKADTQIKNSVIGVRGIRGWFGTPAAADYLNKTRRLQALLSVDALKDFKGFGAMSDREFGTAASAATSIKIDEDKGRITGTTGAFNNELTRIENSMNLILGVSEQSGSTTDSLPQEDKDELKAMSGIEIIPPSDYIEGLFNKN